MSRALAIAVLLVSASTLACPSPVAAQGFEVKPPPPQWKVKLTMEGDKVIEGTLTHQTVQVVSELGTYEIRVEKIKAIRFKAPKEGESGEPSSGDGEVVTHTGATHSGTIHFNGQLAITTDIGFFSPSLPKLRSLEFAGKVPE